MSLLHATWRPPVRSSRIGDEASERNLRSLRERWHWEVQRAWGSGIRKTQVQVQLPHLPAAGYLPLKAAVSSFSKWRWGPPWWSSG